MAEDITKDVAGDAIDTEKAAKQAQELSKQLWAIANDLRGNMDAAKFKNYILGTIFYRYLSERTEEYAKDLLKNDGMTYEEAFAKDDYREAVTHWEIDKLGFVIRPEDLFRELVRKVERPDGIEDRFSVEDYQRAITNVVTSSVGHPSEHHFAGIFDDMRLGDSELGNTVAARTALIGKVLSRVQAIDFDLADSQFDVLGTAYMELIGLFASDADKKSGEFFTPTGPSKLATLGLDEAKTVGDCTCGSGSMLLEVTKHLGKKRVGHYYGQENNASTANLARMNFLMHGVDYSRFDIHTGDTITDDGYGDVKMTVQVCNPPYSLKHPMASTLLNDPRYSAVGKLPPKSAADYAFVEHMIHHMDEKDGRVAVLLPHGVLFRGGAEADIRKWIVRDLNRLDAVISLAPNLFHGTSIPVCLLLLKSDRGEHADDVLFIDASGEFVAGKQKNILTDGNIRKIVDAYVARKDVPKFAHVASMEEIAKNGYNLNMPRYVSMYDADDVLPSGQIFAKLADIEKAKSESIARLQEMTAELYSTDEDSNDE